MSNGMKRARRPEELPEDQKVSAVPAERASEIMSSTPVHVLTEEDRRYLQGLFEVMSGRMTNQPIEPPNEDLVGFYRRITANRSPEEREQIADMMKTYWSYFRPPE